MKIAHASFLIIWKKVNTMTHLCRIGFPPFQALAHEQQQNETLQGHLLNFKSWATHLS
ncbi:uncharacterized protein LOC142592749 isoform X3 [Dermacentor variabilis]